MPRFRSLRNGIWCHATRNLDVPHAVYDERGESVWAEHGDWIVRFDSGQVQAIKREEFERDFQAMDDAAYVEMNLM